MSVEGLLSEVSALLGARLAVRVADQAYFGGKTIFSDAHAIASSSTASAPAAGKKDGKGKKGGNELQSAIQNAKQIASDALSGSSSGFQQLQSDHNALSKKVDDLTALVAKLQTQIASLSAQEPKAAAAPAPAAKAAEPAADGDDDFDLFGSDDEDDEEKKKIVEERLKAYAEKKSKKPGPIAKSSVILDVKPWDDETDLKELEALVRGIAMDGLVWGGSKLIAIGYGISKLQIICVIEDLKVSVDDLIETITGDFESHVQSVDIVAFNKI